VEGKYQTLYEVSYGIVNAEFKDEMTFEEAEKLGKEYCEKNGFKYMDTERVKE
jgi:hypothetical protein